MKCIILLSVLALCHSLPFGSQYGSGYGQGSSLGSLFGTGKNFQVNQDGSITITTAAGKMITITKGMGEGNVVVSVIDPGVSGKQFYLGYQKYQPTQADTLAQILTQYQGDINQDTYQQLLGDVDAAVQTGQLSDTIYGALQNLNQIQGQGQDIVGGQIGQLQQAQLVQQLLQQQIQGQRGLPVFLTGVQQQQFPFEQTTGMMREVVVPVGVTQQGQIVEKMVLQGPEITYPTVAGLIPGSQGVFGQQSFGGSIAGTGKTYLHALINSILQGSGQQQSALPYGQYGQYSVGSIGQMTTGQLSPLEWQILSQQNQIHQEQLQQQQQQHQMLHHQFYHQQQQQQLQGQQEYVQEVQEQVQKEQGHVLGQQQQLQQQQKYNTLMNLLHVTKPYIQTGGQPFGFSQQQLGGGLYGVYGQGIQHHNIPLVY